MPTTLIALDCVVTTSSITIRFSEPVDTPSAGSPDNYTVYDPPAIPAPTSVRNLGWGVPSVATDHLSVTLTPGSPFTPGDFVLVGISGVTAASGGTLAPSDLSGQVPITGGAGRAVRDVEDAISYPILTEEISNRPYPVSTIPSAGGTGGGGGSSSIGQLASRTVTDVLGWKVNAGDPKGFVGALTQAFTLSNVEGHVESKWNPQMPAIQTDLGGSITGAQASLYTRAKDAIDQSSSLLDTLYPLDPEADPEYVKALREMVRSQMTQIVRELAVIGLPSVLRIDTYFSILLNQNPALIQPGDITFNPDDVGGTLGKLRDTYGIQFAGNPFNNSVADEVVITNFRVISDYLTSLLQSWISNRSFFFVVPGQPAFFGTQLVLILRQFNVIAETVNELRFTLDSVFIGPAERQALLLEFADPALPPRFLESMLIEIEAFVGDEGPRLLKDGGKITVTNNILPVVNALLNMVEQAHHPTNIDELPDGFKTARVRNSLDDLEDQLERLTELVNQVEQQVPLSEDALSVSSIILDGPDDSGQFTLEMLGDGMEPGISAVFHSAGPIAVPEVQVIFYSAQRVDIEFDPTVLGLSNGLHDITLTNPEGGSIVLPDVINVGSGGTQTGGGLAPPSVMVNPAFRPGAFRKAAGAKTVIRGSGKTRALRSNGMGKPPQASRSRNFAINMGGSQGPISPMPPVGPPVAPPAAAISKPVQDLTAAQTELGRKVDGQSQQIAGIHQKIDTMFENLKNAIVEHGKALQEKLEQHSRQQQEQLDDKIRQITQKQGK